MVDFTEGLNDRTVFKHWFNVSRSEMSGLLASSPAKWLMLAITFQVRSIYQGLLSPCSRCQDDHSVLLVR